MEHKIDFERHKKFNKRLITWGVTIAAFCLILMILFSYGVTTVKKPNSNDATTVHISIVSGEGSGDIATKLRDASLLRNRFIFILYLNYAQKGDSLQAGEYEVPRNLNMIELAELLSRGKTAENRVTFPEGWTVQKMADRLEAQGIVSAADFKAAVKKNYDYDFLTGKPAAVDLEGFLYPDTYIFDKEATADEIVQKMLDNFDRKRTPDLRVKVAGTNLSLYQVITLASIVEREVAVPADRRLVASVFLNRLSTRMALESCATIQYITGQSKKQFTYEETRVASPYNTYINPGLPPGPIGNPSIDSIEAVLSPEKSNYYYFLSADGKTYFSKTFSEHETKKSQYLK